MPEFVGKFLTDRSCCINSIQTWADDNGFQFSKSKTVSMHFSNQNSIHAEPDLRLYLTDASHIKYLKDRCLKALSLLHVVAHKDWGANSATLLKMYRTHVRSKLDFGCVVYGSARRPWRVLIARSTAHLSWSFSHISYTQSARGIWGTATVPAPPTTEPTVYRQTPLKLFKPSFPLRFQLWFQSPVRCETKRYRNPRPQAARMPLGFRNHIEQYRQVLNPTIPYLGTESTPVTVLAVATR